MVELDAAKAVMQFAGSCYEVTINSVHFLLLWAVGPFQMFRSLSESLVIL
jgi:hypothetical protein